LVGVEFAGVEGEFGKALSAFDVTDGLDVMAVPWIEGALPQLTKVNAATSSQLPLFAYNLASI
jgi:hypothetical protein